MTRFNSTESKFDKVMFLITGLGALVFLGIGVLLDQPWASAVGIFLIVLFLWMRLMFTYELARDNQKRLDYIIERLDKPTLDV